MNTRGCFTQWWISSVQSLLCAFFFHSFIVNMIQCRLYQCQWHQHYRIQVANWEDAQRLENGDRETRYITANNHGSTRTIVPIENTVSTRYFHSLHHEKWRRLYEKWFTTTVCAKFRSEIGSYGSMIFFCVYMHCFFIRSRRLYWRLYSLRKLALMIHSSRISFKGETFIFHLVRFVCMRLSLSTS